MKYIKSIILVLLLFSLTSCKDDLTKRTDAIAPIIIDMHKNKNVDKSKLEEKDKELLKEFDIQERKENKIINISKNIAFSSESYTEAPNTRGIYEMDGEYFIKYTDLNWIENDGVRSAVIDLFGQEDTIYKRNIPVLYEDTKDDDRYLYRFLKKENSEKEIDYYYKSLKDNSGLTIRFIKNNDEISNISLIYKDTIEISTKKEKTGIPLIATIVIFISMGAGIIFLFIRFIKNNKIN